MNAMRPRFKKLITFATKWQIRCDVFTTARLTPKLHVQVKAFKTNAAETPFCTIAPAQRSVKVKRPWQDCSRKNWTLGRKVFFFSSDVYVCWFRHEMQPAEKSNQAGQRWNMLTPGGMWNKCNHVLRSSGCDTNGWGVWPGTMLLTATTKFETETQHSLGEKIRNLNHKKMNVNCGNNVLLLFAAQYCKCGIKPGKNKNNWWNMTPFLCFPGRKLRRHFVATKSTWPTVKIITNSKRKITLIWVYLEKRMGG